MPSPWTIIGWLVLLVLVVVIIAGVSTALEMRQKALAPVPETPPPGRSSGPEDAPEAAPS